VRQRRHRAPAHAGDIGDHGGVDLQTVARREAAGAVGEADHLLGAQQAGERIRVERLQPHVPAPDCVDERVVLRNAGAIQVFFDRPEDLGVPAELRLGGIVGGAPDEADGIGEVLELHLQDLALQVGVADVVVGVGQEMHRAPAHGPEHRLEADLRAAVHTDAHRVGCRGGRRGRQQVQHIQAQPERVCRRRVAAGLHHDRARVGGVIDPELHQLPLAVRGPHQGRLRPRLHRGAERVHEGHVPVARARRHARHPNRHRPDGRKERRRHLQEHVAEGVTHVVRPDVAERQRHAAGAAHGPVLGHAAGAGDEPERRPPVQ